MNAIRAFLVVAGGPLGLAVCALFGVLSTFWSISRGRPPRPLAVSATALTAAYFRFVRPWHLTWGSRSDELGEPLPGDDFLGNTGTLIQHAVDIDAPAGEVWRWVAQIGQDRAGFYSYAWLENLAGCGITNADRIHPEWQEREIGETLPLHPEAGLEVTIFAPERVLGLKNWGNFVVIPNGPTRSRLIVRGRVPRKFAAILAAALFEIPHFVMERKMLLEIKRLAESDRRTGNP